MKHVFKMLMALTFCLSASTAHADLWNKKTIVHLGEGFLVPGAQLTHNYSLAYGGTYVFKLMDSPANRNVVLIYNEDESELLASVMTIPTYRSEAESKPCLEFKHAFNGDLVLNRWWFAGETTGREFVGDIEGFIADIY